MRTDFYSIVLSTLALLANCFNLERELHNFDQSLLETGSNERSSKLFPLFSIVKIPNQPCVPEDSQLSGTCFTNSQCRSVGSSGLTAITSGSCANGFGVCCVVTATCESVVIHNNTNFRNRDYPSGFNPSGLEVCNVRIQKPSPNVCQVRLDFTNMQLAGADATSGQCMVDRLTINGGSGSSPPNLCGTLSGQHMYFDYGSSDRLQLSIITDGAIPMSRSWLVKITYIECNSLSRAPPGCLQYYTGTSSEVRMLGYPMSAHLADLDYSVCVRPEDGAGSIVWSPCQGEPIASAFLLTGDAMPAGGPGVPGTMCPDDFVTIFTDDTAMPIVKMDDRYCGNAFNAAMSPFQVRSIAKPFIMRVRTNGDEGTTDMENTGFCLAYRQEPPRPSG